MIDTLNIGAYIYSKLCDIEGVKIYPLIADNDAKFPFVVYKRTGLTSTGCKDGFYEDRASVQINVVTDKYATGVGIANEIRSRLEGSGNYNGMRIYQGTLSSASEDYTSNSYVQTMTFNFEINN